MQGRVLESWSGYRLCQWPSLNYIYQTNTAVVLPEYLEDIVQGSHTSLGDTGRQALRDLLHHYEHVFLAPGEPVDRTNESVQHEIVTKDARPVRCGPRRLAPGGLRKEQECVKDMLTGGQIEPSDSPWASPVVFGNEERRFNMLLR